MNRQTNKIHCDLPHPPKGYDIISKQIGEDTMLVIVKIVDTSVRILIETTKQSSPLATYHVRDSHVADSHASEEVVDDEEVEEQDLD